MPDLVVYIIAFVIFIAMFVLAYCLLAANSPKTDEEQRLADEEQMRAISEMKKKKK